MNTFTIKNLSKDYKKVKALDNISIEINEGVTGLLGHNGAGKSTFIKILAGIIKEYKGEVLFNGENIKKLGMNYNSLIGYVPQQQYIDMELSVLGFLNYMKAMKLVKSKDIDLEYILDKTNLLDNKDKKLKNLSGGMKQRVLIAQSILNDPKIILLDEPTAGLDPFERMNLRNLISDLSKDRIIILATHVISDIEFISNDLIFLKNGKLVSSGKQEKFIDNIKVFESYESEEELRKRDSDLILVNKIRTSNGIKIRYISDMDFDNRVSTNLDDVYLGVLK